MLRILLIDDCADYRNLLIKHFELIRPDIQIVEYDPVAERLPGSHFPWANYGLVFLDYDLGLGKENGLGWMMHFSSIKNMPPVIMLTAESKSNIAVKALQAGAMDFIDKEDVSHEVLKTTLDDFFSTQVSSTLATTPTAGKDSELLFSAGNINNNAGSAVSDTIDLYKDTNALMPDNITVPGYTIIKEIGKGGMSIVLLAKPDEEETEIVLKVMFTEKHGDETGLKRFMQEYNLISSLDHPNVIRIYERAFASDFAYIAMEYFPGGDLTRKIKSGLPLNLALEYIRQMCCGLIAIHELDIVHRDIKPGNILFRNDDTLTITDFGAAKNTGSTGRDITINHAIVGTPYYMSPEQATGMVIDHRSDLYSLGILFYQMLTNEKPFLAKSIPHLISMHVSAPVPRLPEHLEKYQPIVDGLLAKDPNDRFQSANDVITGLEWIG